MRGTTIHHRGRRTRAATLVGAVAALASLVLTGPAGAQTTTPTTGAPPATTTPPTTAPPAPPTTAAGGGTATPVPTTAPVTATTVAPLVTVEDDGDSDDGIPIVPAVIGIAILAALGAGFAVWAKKRGAARQHATDWRLHAADVTAEAGATARLLSTGTPVSGAIAQQLLTSIRTFEDLGDSAPDDIDAEAAQRARRALQTLGLAIDSDYRVRKSGAPQEQIDASAASVRNAAAETDRTLRGVYRTFTDSD